MCLRLLLPTVRPEKIAEPVQCPSPDCDGRRFHLHQPVIKTVRDMQYQHVQAYRYKCLKCQHTFRIYPQGVSGAHISQRVKDLAVILYLSGLSYGGVSRLLEGLGAHLCKSQVYEAVREAAGEIPGLERGLIFSGLRTAEDFTSVRYRGRWLSLRMTTDHYAGLNMTIATSTAEDTSLIREAIEPIIKRVGAQVLVADDPGDVRANVDKLRMQQANVA